VTHRFWRSMVVICLLQGVATTVNPYVGMLAGMFIGLYLATHLWFEDHPATWWYDLILCATLGSAALGGAGAYVGICQMLRFAGIATGVCQSLGFARAFWLHLSMIGFIGGGFWLSVRLWAWWRLRRR